ncbi:hypothetical protein ACFE04_008952 [Oxalis oulophora]
MEVKRMLYLVLLVMFVIIASESKRSNGCLDHERNALLQLRTVLDSPDELLDWVEAESKHNNTSESDCCNWDRVVCDVTTKNVIQLHLGVTKTRGSKKWYLNLTLLLPFQKLQSLDLSLNFLGGIVTDEGFESLSKLSNLEYLDLSDNYFNNSILSFLKALPSLKNLDLSSNALQGTLHIPDTLLNLDELDISYNSIKEFVIPKGNKSLSKLKRLYMWRMDTDQIKLLQSMGSLLLLNKLHLGENTFNKTETTMKLYNIPNLEELYMNDSVIHTSTFHSFDALSSIKYLDLGGSIFDGQFNAQDLPNFKKLEALDMSYSALNSKFLQSIQDMDALKELWLFRSGLNGSLSESQGLCDLRHLEVLDLSDNHLEGTLPSCLANLTSLQTLGLSNNQFTGDIAKSPITSSYSNLKFLDISNNLFYGEIPSHFGISFPNLQYLNMSSNEFDGHIPSSFGDMSLLQTLDLSNNKLFGNIPKQLATGCVALYTLTLSHNRLDGEIFGGDFNLTGLEELRMAGNNFSGMIPKIFYSTRIFVLDISDNNLSGQLPAWMGNMSNLWDLNMSKNRLEGHIPIEFCHLESLQALDLSENNISGNIPSCFSPPGIQVVRLSKNKLQGTLEHALSDSSSIMLLDLSNNQLSGSLPSWLHRLPDLNFLLLNNNHLGGQFPTQLCQLKKLSLINLSHNYLYGIVPDCLRITPVEEQHDINVVEDPYEVPNTNAPSPSTASSTFVSGPSYASSPAKATRDVTIDNVEFPTKSMSYNYQGEILNMMSGIDLSCNNFFGKIPPQLGSLSSIHALNLSHNNLSGPIPSSFGNLKQVESLDLSDNLLIGNIPPELGELSSLSVFTVANNNLSGEIPTTTQFTTFNERSFLGNPLLCGTPLPKKCNAIGPEQPGAQVDDGEKDRFIDMECFYVSFGATYITVILWLVIVLMINPYWRRWWFYHVEKWVTSSYYFAVDNLHKIFFPRKVSP